MKGGWKYLIIILIILILLIGGYFAYREYQLHKLKKSYLNLMQCLTSCPGGNYTVTPLEPGERNLWNLTVNNQTTITFWKEECMKNCGETYKVDIPSFIWNFNQNYEYFQGKTRNMERDLGNCISNNDIKYYTSLDSLNDCIKRVIERYS